MGYSLYASEALAFTLRFFTVTIFALFVSTSEEFIYFMERFSIGRNKTRSFYTEKILSYFLTAWDFISRKQQHFLINTLISSPEKTGECGPKRNPFVTSGGKNHVHSLFLLQCFFFCLVPRLEVFWVTMDGHRTQKEDWLAASWNRLSTTT